MKVSITKIASQMTVAAPYNEVFVSRARSLDGKFNASSKTWEFNARDESRVRAACVECFGTDGTVTDFVTLRISIPDGLDLAVRSGMAKFAVYGRQIADPRLGDGVVLLSGGFKEVNPALAYILKGSAVSAARRRREVEALDRQTCTVVAPGTAVLVRDFPRAAAEELVARQPEAGIVYAIEHEAQAVDVEALSNERAKLIARIADIDQLLAAAKAN